MTTYKISELPIPYRSAGAPPLGTHEGASTPPEPPTPPTPPAPTGTVYFSGTSIDSEEVYAGHYAYFFDASGSEHADVLYEKQVGDELSVTVNGVEQIIPIILREPFEEDSEAGANMAIGLLDEEFPIVSGTPIHHIGEDDWSISALTYYSTTEIAAGVTLKIADPE